MSSYEHIDDDLRVLWRGLGRISYTSQRDDSEARRMLDYVRRSERRSVARRLVRRHILLAILGCIVIPLDMICLCLNAEVSFSTCLALSLYGVFAGLCAAWVGWQVHNFDYGKLTMREAWHKANMLYERRNMLRNISLCLGIPLIIILIISLSDALGRPGMVGAIVGAVIGGAIGLYQNFRTQQQMRQMRDTFDNDN